MDFYRAIGRAALVAIIVVIIVVAVIALSVVLLVRSPSQTGVSITSTAMQVRALPQGATPLPFAGNKVIFSLVANGLNFNGSSKGSLIIYIPAGWGVEISFTNNRTVGHNIAIVRNNTATPQSNDIGSDGSVIASQPAQYTSGIPQGSTVQLTVNSLQEGVYWIACGVPSHARSGMWIILVASSSVSTPYAISLQ